MTKPIGIAAQRRGWSDDSIAAGERVTIEGDPGNYLLPYDCDPSCGE